MELTRPTAVVKHVPEPTQAYLAAPSTFNEFGGLHRGDAGTEFYGPAAVLSFLTHLHARAEHLHASVSGRSHTAPTETILNSHTISNLLPYQDEEAAGTPKVPDRNKVAKWPHANLDRLPIPSSDQPDDHVTHSISRAPKVQSTDVNIDTQKDCIQLFFTNLHTIHYFLDKGSFMQRCEAELWHRSDKSDIGTRHRTLSRFPALYYAVLAVGAVTAGNDTAIGLGYGSLELAWMFFNKARTLIGDFFQSSGIETVQTLFLLSIFNQYAFKPHACYMYSSAAIRAAFTVGMGNQPDLSQNSATSIRTFWCMYYHEMETCCSQGRESFLREPAYYPVYLAPWGLPVPPYLKPYDDQNLFFASAMTELARILLRIMEDIYRPISASNQDFKAELALGLDKNLCQWRDQLAPGFDLEEVSLTEPEKVTKRKIVIKLRLQSARILIHRPILVAAALAGDGSYLDNVRLCIQAAEETIELLYHTFLTRPFFRTWWYNATYAFNAITIILYALVSDFEGIARDRLVKLVQQSLSIFQAMSGLGVARRCAELTSDIFEIAKASTNNQSKITKPDEASRAGINASYGEPGRGIEFGNSISSCENNNMMDILGQEDFFATLVDTDMLHALDANWTDLGFDMSSFGDFSTSGEPSLW